MCLALGLLAVATFIISNNNFNGNIMPRFTEWPNDPHAYIRNREWDGLRNKFLMVHKECLACGKKDNLRCHHIKSISDYPELELEWGNLIALCDRCHLVIGHLNSWHLINTSVVEDSKLLRSRHPK